MRVHCLEERVSRVKHAVHIKHIFAVVDELSLNSNAAAIACTVKHISYVGRCVASCVKLVYVNAVALVGDDIEESEDIYRIRIHSSEPSSPMGPCHGCI